MVVCEYFFKEFYSRGSDEYLNSWAAQVDRLGREGWEVLDSTRSQGRPGLWTVVLGRPAAEFRGLNAGRFRRRDAEGSGQT